MIDTKVRLILRHPNGEVHDEGRDFALPFIPPIGTIIHIPAEDNYDIRFTIEGCSMNPVYGNKWKEWEVSVTAVLSDDRFVGAPDELWKTIGRAFERRRR